MGRWMLLTSAASIVTALGYTYSMLYFDPTKAQNALFFAIGTAMKLANPVTNSMSGMITPAVARESVGPGGMRAATRMAMRYSALGAALLMPYFLVIIFFATPVLRFLSKGDARYYEHGNLLRLYVANYVMVYLVAVMGAWLGGLGRSRHIFYVQVVNVIGAILIGLPMTLHWGVAGLCVGGLISSTATTITAMYFIYKLAHHPPTDTHTPASHA